MKKGQTNFLMIIMLFYLGCGMDEAAPSLQVNNEANEFVWNGMNQFYYWQSEVPQLDDQINNSSSSFTEFLNTYSGPEVLFNSLIYKDDRFSWIVDDYEILEASFQGVTISFGYEFGLINPTGTEQVFGYVKYVVPGSPASEGQIERGDLFTAVDNQPLTLNNYISLLFEQSSYDLTLGEYRDGEVTSTSRVVSLTAEQLTENPIHLTKVLTINEKKIGYMVYNQFVNNDRYHLEMNSAFGEFNDQNISELVLDLRYNLGGSITTTQLLASMIYGRGLSTDVFLSIIYNEKLNDVFAGQDLNYYFLSTVPNTTERLNRLDIDRLYVLTSDKTASASEFIIAGLSPYMDVTVIGGQTVGKNVGSVTLYDSPNEFYLEKGSDLNPNHRYAMQPIISQLANSNGFTDYINGFVPDILIEEKDLIGDIHPLGDMDEHLLRAAIELIQGSGRIATPEKHPEAQLVFDSQNREEFLQSALLDNLEAPIN